MDMKRFGKKLREKRKYHGMMYQELADLCYINHGYVRQLEAGSWKQITQYPASF